MQILDIICINKEDYIITGQKTLTIGNTVVFIKNTIQISSYVSLNVNAKKDVCRCLSESNIFSIVLIKSS